MRHENVKQSSGSDGGKILHGTRENFPPIMPLSDRLDGDRIKTRASVKKIMDKFPMYMYMI